ncbi:MAG: hypothetical protein EOO46_24070 [Flavobacterium sp.]|nr:MAG: hypothetical protein EOO46_24070 [Flavobacterium sp.]
MIEGDDYIKIVKEYFSFLPLERNMTDIIDKVRGNVFYDVQFHYQSKVISISYENIEDYLQVIVFMLRNGEMPDYDDKSSTLHLNALTKIAFSKATKGDIELNNSFFNSFNPDNDFKRKLLKSAKDLRLSMKMIDSL